MIKKLTALFLVFIYVSVINLVYAYNQLYYISNVKPAIINSYAEYFLKKDYTIRNTNPIYAVSKNNPERYVSIVVQPTGQDLYYYFESSKKDTSANKNILKTLSEKGISYKVYQNDNYMSYFTQLAESAKTGEKKTYSFETEQTPQPVYQQPTQQADNTKLQGYVANLGAGTNLDIYLQNAINTATANVGDSVVGVLKSNWVVKNRLLASQGSLVYGDLTKAEHARAGMRNGQVTINFNQLVTPEGKSYKLVTEPVVFNVTNDGKLKSSAGKIVAAAAMGALAGLLCAALAGGGHYGRGAAIGAGVAAGVSAVTTVAEKGVDAEIPSYTELEVQVKQNINIVVNN